MISHSEVIHITQNDMIGTKLGVDLELRSGREVFLMKAWRLLCIGSPRSPHQPQQVNVNAKIFKCQLRNFQEKFPVGRENAHWRRWISLEMFLLGGQSDVDSSTSN